MAEYLHRVLAGDIELDSVKDWIVGSSGLPPTPLGSGSPRSPPTSSNALVITAEQLRAETLNYVKEQADLLFLASDKRVAEANAAAQADKGRSSSKPAWPAGHARSQAPGLVTENSFPALAVASGKKDALDRRLSLQPPQAAHTSSSSPAPQKQNQRGRKIAPTRIQSAAEPILRNQLPFGTVSTGQLPEEEAAGLAVEASARDLFCPEQASDHLQGQLGPVVSSTPQAAAQTPSPAHSAWSRPLTPSSTGSTASQAQSRQADANRAVKWPQQTLSPSGSMNSQAHLKQTDANRAMKQPQQTLSPALSTHSAPATVTPCKASGKTKRISPSPLGEAPVSGAVNGVRSGQASAWQNLHHQQSHHQQSHHQRSQPQQSHHQQSHPQQLLPANSPSHGVPLKASGGNIRANADGPQLKKALSSGTGKLAPGSGQKAASRHHNSFDSPLGSAWGRPTASANSASASSAPDRSAWSSPTLHSHQSRLQHAASYPQQDSGSSPAHGQNSRLQHSVSCAQQLSSPDSTATSAFTPAWKGRAPLRSPHTPSSAAQDPFATPQRPTQTMSGTPPESQTRSECGSTGTDYATPCSTLHPWQDASAEREHMSPDNAFGTPQAQHLSSRFASEASSASGASPSPSLGSTSRTPCSAWQQLASTTDAQSEASLMLEAKANKVLTHRLQQALPSAHAAQSPPSALHQPATAEAGLVSTGFALQQGGSDHLAASCDPLAAEHPQQLQQAAHICTDPTLSDKAQRLANLHAHIITVVPSVSLAAELDLLLHLIALPPSLVLTPSSETDLQLMFSSGPVAALYASQVLVLSGRLIPSLSKHMLESIAEVPTLKQHAPALMADAQHQLEMLNAMALPHDVRLTGGSSGRHLFGAGAFTQDGQPQRTQEDQRRVSNMNDCRDGWAKLMRAAADQQTQPFKGSSVRQGLSQSPAQDANVAVLMHMQQHARRSLRGLRLDNYATFAELFITALLQAAATGETLLDDDSPSTQKLQKLADKDTSKFYRLNQRMQGQAAGHRPSHQGRYATNSGGVRSGGNSPFASPGVASQPSHSEPLHFGFQSRSSGSLTAQQSSVTDADLADVAVALQFPQAQRLFVMFVQAADSHKLNSSLVRCMRARLQQMHQSALTDSATSDRLRSERLVSQCCIASFLSLLTFTGSCGISQPHDSSSNSHVCPIPELHIALQAALHSNIVEWVVPWIVQYLRFLSHDVDSQHSSQVQQVLGCLRSLQSCAILLPQSAEFGPMALCLRTVLDEHLEQMADVEVMPEVMPDADWLAALDSWQAAVKLSRSVLDVRYMQLCCPLLEHARQAVQAAASAEGSQWEGNRAALKGVRKITPSQPLGVSLTPNSELPPALAAAVEGATGSDAHPVKLKLQHAFLEQYSSNEHKVRLKDVVTYITSIIAQNAVSSSFERCLPALAKTAAEDFFSRCQDIVRQSSGSNSEDQQDSSSARAGLSTHARLQIDSCADSCVGSACYKALDECYNEAAKVVDQQAVHALAALSPPSWTAAVIGSAAAIVAETAKGSSAQQIVSQSTAVRKQIKQQVESASAALIKSYTRQSAAQTMSTMSE